MKRPLRGMASVPHVVTCDELDQRLAARSKPTVERQLNIGGWEEVEVRRQVDTSSERRIAQLRGSLEKAHEGLSTDHRLATLQGFAAKEFGRCRRKRRYFEKRV